MKDDPRSESGWWYFSFADDDGFLGGLYVDGERVSQAITKSHLLGLNPGGEIQFVPVPSEVLPDISEQDRLRLLPREEVEA